MLTSSKIAQEAADETIRSDSDSAKTTAKVQSLNCVLHVLQPNMQSNMFMANNECISCCSHCLPQWTNE